MRRAVPQLSQNPLSSGQKIGIGALVLLGVGGAAYYFIMGNKNKAMGFKIVSYRDVTANGPIVPAGINMTAKTGDNIAVNVEFSYHGDQVLAAQLHVATWVPATGVVKIFKPDNQVDGGVISLNLESSILPKKYSKKIEFQLNGVEDEYYLAAWLTKPGQDFYATAPGAAVLKIDNAGQVGDPENNVNSIETVPVVIASPVSIGQSVNFKVNYVYKGADTPNLKISSSLGKATSTGFKPIRTVITLPPTNGHVVTTGPQSADISIPLTEADLLKLSAADRNSLDLELKIPSTALLFSVNGSPDVYRRVEVNTYLKEHFVTTDFVLVPTLTVTNSPVKVGQTLNYSFTNCTPSGAVVISIENGGGLTKTAGSNGSASGGIQTAGLSPGNYTLNLVDQTSGATASAPFVINPATGNPVLNVTSPIALGAGLHFTFSGFGPSLSVTVLIVETGGSGAFTANSSGAGSGILQTASEPAGAYTLRATDSAGSTASKPFVINPGSGGGPFTVSTAVSPAGIAAAPTVSPVMSSYPFETQATFTAAPAPSGYAFDHFSWSTGSSSYNPLTMLIISNVVVTAVYTQVSTSGSMQGRVTNIGGSPLSAQVIAQGSGGGPVSVMTNPSTGEYSMSMAPGAYSVHAIASGGGYDPSPTYQVNVPAGSLVELDFALYPISVQPNTLYLSISPDRSGNPPNESFIDVSPAGTLIGDGIIEFPPGTVVTLTAYDVNPYQFSQWNNGQTSRSRQVTMSTDLSVVAIYQHIDTDPNAPQFPAPGTPGDGEQWYWMVSGNQIYVQTGWYSYQSYLIILGDPFLSSFIGNVYGPYASGATS